MTNLLTLRMYATCWCGDCALARRFLKSRAIAWVEVDVDEDAGADAQVLEHNNGTRHLPVFEWNGEWKTVSPFDRGELGRWLLQRGAVEERQVSDLQEPSDQTTQ